jgi:hypothetical protein
MSLEVQGLERGNHRKRGYHSFTNHENPEIVCS